MRIFPSGQAGRSGLPEISGRVIRVKNISGFQKRHPNFRGFFYYPTFRVPDKIGFGSGIPELPENCTAG